MISTTTEKNMVWKNKPMLWFSWTVHTCKACSNVVQYCDLDITSADYDFHWYFGVMTDKYTFWGLN